MNHKSDRQTAEEIVDGLPQTVFRPEGLRTLLINAITSALAARSAAVVWIPVAERLPERGVVMVGGWNHQGDCAWRQLANYDGGDNRTWTAFRGSAGEDIHPSHWWDGPLPPEMTREAAQSTLPKEPNRA